MSNHDDQAKPSKGEVQVGDSAPDFTLPDQSGAPISLWDFLKKKACSLQPGWRVKDG